MRPEVRRYRLPIIISVLSGAFALLAAPAAFAGKAQVCVDPDSSKCFATIQEGVDAAQSGQAIDIASGEYLENVVITKTALQLLGSGQGKTVLRGDPGPIGALSSLTINNNSVVIEKMTIRGAGIFIAPQVNGPTAKGVVLDDVEVTDVLGNCIVTRSNQTFIRNSTIGSCTGACIATGVFSSNESTEIRKNRIGPCGTDGLAAGVANSASRSDSMIIDKNDFIGADDSCIDVRGESNTITRNNVKLCGDIGISSVGTNPLIERNSVASTGSDGIFQNCFLPARPNQMPPDRNKICTSGTISKNDVEETVGIGIHVPALPVSGGFFSDPTPIVLEKNSVENAVGGGMRLLGNGMEARKNSVKDSGNSRDTPCFTIEGNDSVIESNTGDGCAGNGFTIDGDRNNLNKNKANNNQRIGFEVVAGNPEGDVPRDSEDNVLSENSAKKNGIYGFVVSLDDDANLVATNTVLNDDKASGNLRADLCNAGVNTTINGGKYKVIGEDRTEDGECFSW